MDFIGHLSASKTFDGDMSLSGGVSLYLGGTRQTDSMVYVMRDNRFVLHSDARSNIGKFAKRQYFGIDLQYGAKTRAGWTRLRGEYIWGKHPQDADGDFGFNARAYPAFVGATFMREISGGYVVLTQDFGRLPFTAIVKYDWYNPNTGVSGNNIASEEFLKNPTDVLAAGTGIHGDITRTTLGLGLMWHINNLLILTAYYDIARNERTENLRDIRNAYGQIISYGFENNRPADVFTLRLQYRFNVN